jgi:hypothetical protein
MRPAQGCWRCREEREGKWLADGHFLALTCLPAPGGLPARAGSAAFAVALRSWDLGRSNRPRAPSTLC